MKYVRVICAALRTLSSLHAFNLVLLTLVLGLSLNTLFVSCANTIEDLEKHPAAFLAGHKLELIP